MHYYQHHIGDFTKDTAFLTNAEAMVYLKLLWLYYDTEQPLPNDLFMLSMRTNTRDDEQMLDGILKMYFTLFDNVWRHDRCDREIAEYQTKSIQASRAGKASAQRRANGRSTDAQPTINQEPLTINHIVGNTTDVVFLPKVRRNGTRLPADWTLPKDWADWAKQERPDLNAHSVGEQFKDFWVAKVGAGATKLDWLATWRNWVRNQKAPRINPADAIRTTVPSTTERDPTLVRLEEERKNCKPPAPEVLAKMKALKGKVFGVNDNAKETL
jgi:uncharacterized protein YdaU (DUF1376 family)